MAPRKRAQRDVSRFLDLDARDEGESASSDEDNDYERELSFEPDENAFPTPPNVVFDAPAEDQQALFEAYIDGLLTRRHPHIHANPPLPLFHPTRQPTPTQANAPQPEAGPSHVPSLQISRTGHAPDGLRLPMESDQLYPWAPRLRSQTPHSDPAEIPHYLQMDTEEREVMRRRRERVLNIPSCDPQRLEDEDRLYASRKDVGPAEWVVIRGGLYHGDVGLIVGNTPPEGNDCAQEQRPGSREYSGEYLLRRIKRHYGESVERLATVDDTFNVLLVPRLRASKRKREAGSGRNKRPLPRLFDPEGRSGVESAYEFECVRPDGSIYNALQYVYKEQTFLDGLLLAEYPRSHLKLATDLPTVLEDPFQNTTFPEVLSCPLPHPATWSFEEGERVKWVQSSKSCQTGVLMNVVVARRGTQPQTAIVTFPDGVFPAPTRQLLKTHEVDDWVLLQKGDHKGKPGVVLSRADTAIVVLLRDQKQVISVHVNSAKGIPALEERDELVDPQQALVGIGAKKELIPVPWRGTNVRITAGQFRDSRGVVQSVERIEGRVGRRLLIGIWLDVDLKLVFVDYDNVVHIGTFKRLKDWQPLSSIQHTIYGLSRSMSTGREPWLGTRVLVVGGEFKGEYGYVRRVEVTWETEKLRRDVNVVGKTVGRRRGIKLAIDLETQRAGQAGLQAISYLKVVDAVRRVFLNRAYPVKA
ncbi:hypothetical protein V5O48_018103, partial [Marasmius crinis-equi]